MSTLVPIDGSRTSLEAVKYAARNSATRGLLLLHVAPSARQSDLERGRFLLESGRRTGLREAEDLRIETRLEIGEQKDKVSLVAADAGCDLLVMGAHGVNSLPHVDSVSEDASRLQEQVHIPVVLVLPTGQGVPSQATNSSHTQPAWFGELSENEEDAPADTTFAGAAA